MQTTSNPPMIEIRQVSKWYGDFHVLRDINLKVMRGERIVIAPVAENIHRFDAEGRAIARNPARGAA